MIIPRIQGALSIWDPSSSQHDRARSERSRKTTKEFLTQHWEVILAAEFFTLRSGRLTTCLTSDSDEPLRAKECVHGYRESIEQKTKS